MYRNAVAKSPSTPNALRVYNATLAGGDAKSATAFLESWIKSHPADRVTQQALAEGYLRQGDYPNAQARYEALLKTGAEDPSVLNNLAVIADRLGNGAKAVEYAQRAAKAGSGNPGILDTLGWLLVRRGDFESGLRYLREAKVRDPRNPEIRFHLASALAMGGRKSEARQELTLLLSDTPGFPGANDARALLKELGG
jgi:Tfp pilus assembly protein PilF